MIAAWCKFWRPGHAPKDFEKHKQVTPINWGYSRQLGATATIWLTLEWASRAKTAVFGFNFQPWLKANIKNECFYSKESPGESLQSSVTVVQEGLVKLKILALLLPPSHLRVWCVCRVWACNQSTGQEKWFVKMEKIKFCWAKSGE